MIRQFGKLFVLDTLNTTYCFRVLETGHLEHLYYGAKIYIDSEKEADVLAEKHAFAPGNTNIYDSNHAQFSLEDMRLEMSSYGKSDIREPFIIERHCDGGRTSDYLYSSAKISEGKTPLNTLPSSYDDDKRVDELEIKLTDKNYGMTLLLKYSVFEERDVITRSSKIINSSLDKIVIEKIMSNQIDFETSGFILTTFNGSWAHEMNRYDTEIKSGKTINSSFTGSSSNRANPFVMLSTKDTSEDSGICYGFNLVYSGNHYEAVEVNSYHKTRFVSGINPEGFEYTLEPGDEFEAPEAVMTFSEDGFNGMSQRIDRKSVV